MTIELSAGARVGRYLVSRRVAAGAMGVVYEAFDPRLQRRVALKVLRPDLLSRRASIRERLLREAQALAMVDHPNVVRVFDVGPIQDSIFVAMEFVAGESAHEWLLRHNPWPRILDVFIDAARGLSAIHAAGLVHRDFKPGNLVIGGDGRVRVLDLGLARAAGAPSEATTLAVRRSRPNHSVSASHEITGRLQEPITAVGTAVGTPPYMAPEQHTGEDSDARADQFAFCVSLYEALARRRPFVGRTADELALAKQRGQLPSPPRDIAVPRAVFAVLARGMRPRPSRRFASMLALVDALQRARRPRVERWGLLGLAAGAAIATTTAAVLGAFDAPSTCDVQRSPLPNTISAPRLEALRASFATSGVDPSGVAWSSTHARVTEFTDAWTNAWVDACERRRQTPATEAADRTSSCLAERLTELDTRLSVLERGTQLQIENAVLVVSGLRSPLGCLHGELDDGAPRAPVEIRAEVEEIRRTIDGSAALEDTGAFTDAIARANEAATAAAALGYGPLIAEALHRRGRALDAAGRGVEAIEPLREAAIVAAAEGHHRIAAAAAIDLGGLHRHLSMRDAERWLRRAEATVHRLGEPPELRRAWLNNRALLDIASDHPTEGYARLRAALSLTRELHGARHPAVARALDNLSVAAHRLGRLPEARALSAEALDVLVSELGDRHPHVGRALINAGGLALAAADFDGAVGHYQAALAIYERPDSGRSTATAYALDGLGYALSSLGRHDEALTHQRRALAVLHAADPNGPSLATSHLSIGHSLSGMERHGEALEHFERAVEIFADAYGEEHTATAAAHNDVGTALQLLGRWDEARAAYQRALDTLRATASPSPAELAKTLGNLAYLARRAGKLDESRDALTEALSLLDTPAHADPHVEARLQAALGEVELEAGNLDAAREWLARAVPQMHRVGAPAADIEAAEASLARARDGA